MGTGPRKMHTAEKGRQVRCSVSSLGEFMEAVISLSVSQDLQCNPPLHKCLYGGALEKPGRGTEFQVWVAARWRRKKGSGEMS